MSILVFGKSGQVGQELQRALAPFSNVTFLDRKACDLTDHAKIAEIINHFKPKMIVKASAYTTVDLAEKEVEKAYAVNAKACEVMARAAHNHKAHLIHYSTDYVYDGKKQGIYGDNEPHAPLGVYGASKSAGEKAISDETDQFTIFRTSWVYHLFGACFPKAILKKATTAPRLDVVDDQVGSPTSAALIADITAIAMREILRAPNEKYNGHFNLVSRDYTSWYDYARLLVSEAGLTPEVHPSKTVWSEGKSHRPENSRLSVEKIEKAFGVTMPHWSQDVKRFVVDYQRAKALF